MLTLNFNFRDEEASNHAKFRHAYKAIHNSLRSAAELEKLERQVMDRIRAECAGVEWTGSYAVFGPYDYVDIFEAPDNDTAMKAATIIRTFGHAQTEIWPATEWSAYKQMVRDLPAGEAV